MKAAKVIWVVALPCLIETSHAQEVYLQGGTLGVGVGAAWTVNSWFGVHADFNAINLSHNFEVGGNRYEDGIRLRQGLQAIADTEVGHRGWIAGGRRRVFARKGNSVPTNGMYVFEGKASPVDLGVAYGIPKSSYTLSPALAQAAGPEMSQQIINTGLQQLRDKASPYRWYPTLQIGVSYRF